jgi:hypothetical protein
MSTSILILAAAAMLSAQSSTNLTWNGSLIDESCHATSAAAQCEVDEQTRAFGVKTDDGKYFKLDIDGNNKAREALTAQKKSGSIKVAVSGLLEGETIKVATLQIR